MFHKYQVIFFFQYWNKDKKFSRLTFNQVIDYLNKLIIIFEKLKLRYHQTKKINHINTF